MGCQKNASICFDDSQFQSPQNLANSRTVSNKKVWLGKITEINHTVYVYLDLKVNGLSIFKIFFGYISL